VRRKILKVSLPVGREKISYLGETLIFGSISGASSRRKGSFHSLVFGVKGRIPARKGSSLSRTSEKEKESRCPREKGGKLLHRKLSPENFLGERGIS